MAGRMRSQGASLRDVAKLAEVSIATASKVLNTGHELHRIGPATIDRVREAAKQLDYIPNYHAQSLQARSSRSIGIALDAVSRGRDALYLSYWGAMIGGVQSIAQDLGWEISIISPKQEGTAVDVGFVHLRQRRIDGLIIPGVTAKAQDTSWELDEDIKAVLVEHPGPGSVPTIDIDNASAVALAVDHLMEQGHKQVLWLGPEGSRLTAIRAVSKERGLGLRECLFPRDREKQSTTDVINSASAALADALTGEPAGNPSFTAIVCWSDLVASAAYRLLAVRGLRVPADVSVIGFDDVQAVLLSPPLTSINHSMFDMGRRAAELIREMSTDETALTRLRGHREVMAPQLTVRSSTGPAPTH